ncbi:MULTISPECIES: 30S ribosomal protein S5 [unclassified Oceanispirochaeta]|uniref:30S ribosomal protein S5 n=1 Tax=unclassified Oceanispirochaeta TaxID=2635722 RepID=UPI000E08E981|nr:MULTISPECIES: 30S ribosomal protein S5 [unclassified Oceanispirochaeta]MBF9017146.1 30S ribosomal protein S5 [Oceanispirochaeta sp. M2]NPD73595.1 30S ribosomal protein S5 [Oceanispirochaeta sp. M1]RDG30699.1 30S ribosomal protein S5 [Oceanispirochaeta sp. M1]
MAYDKRQKEEKEFTEKLIRLNRVSKAVKGGRKMSFSALMVVGDGKGRVGYGFGKANDVAEAIRKSVEKAKGNLRTIPLKKVTIPHEILGEFKSASVLLKPAAPGTGIIAGGPVRAIMEAAGIHDILAKSLGSKNTMNIVKSVFNGLDNLFDAKSVAAGRGKKINELWG